MAFGLGKVQLRYEFRGKSRLIGGMAMEYDALR